MRQPAASRLSSTVITSTDGLSWQSLPDSPGMRKITFGEGRWVGISGGGQYHYSDDLLSWTTVSGNYIQENICYGMGKFLSVGGQGYVGSPSIIQWSENGASWNYAGAADSETIWGVQQGCSYANGIFVIAGADTQSGYHPRATYTSTNAISWSREQTVSPVNVHAPNGYLTDVAGYEDKPFIAVGSKGEIWKSSDGINWSITDPSPREYLNKLKYANGHYVAVGGRVGYIASPPGAAAIFSSTNGVDWLSYIPNRIDTLSDITYGEGTWVATGDDGGIFTSQDAVHWTNRSWPSTNNDLDIIVYGAGRFVAFSVNRDRIYHSEDSIIWQITDGPPVADVNCAAFINNEFIACGENGLILVSANGFDWVDRSIDTDDDFCALCYGKGRYVLAGYDSVFSSTNGIDWESAEMNLPPREILYSEGWFIGNNLEVSRDGLHWYAPPDDFFLDYSRFESMAITDEQLVVIDGLELWTASIDLEQLHELTLIKNSGLEYPSQSNKTYRLLHSYDLKSWLPYGSWAEGSGDYLLWKADYTQPQCFWRVEELE